jgi:tetraacyldisaccharide 4'-kinase
VNPLSALFGMAVRSRNDLYDRGTLHSRRLEGPVVSIGNVTVGGSGKTPLLILLGELLQKRGITFDVLSRGYRRESKGVATVDPNGSAGAFGDEPLLIARKLNVPVIVGEDRFAAGQFAEEKYGPRLHLLDDGFQHRRLTRDFDIVLITPGDAEDSLLPIGRLREPISSLARADAVVLSGGASPEGLQLSSQQVWHVRRQIILPKIEGPCVAFCGIANPEQFFSQLRAAGVALAATRSFRDHHPYGHSDLRTLMDLRQNSGATAFITTEKDAVNLGAKLVELEPIHVVPLCLELDDAGSAVDSLLAIVERRRNRPS